MEPFLSKTVGGSAHEMVITVFVRVCLWTMEPLSSKTVGGSARDEFHRFCSRSFDYEPWNHIPQVIEGSTCDDRLRFWSRRFRAWTMEPFPIAKLYGGARSGSPQQCNAHFMHPCMMSAPTHKFHVIPKDMVYSVTKVWSFLELLD